MKKIRNVLATAQQGLDNNPLHEETQIPKPASFPEISGEDLKKIILGAPTKCCQLDPIPTHILKECFDLLPSTFLKIISKSLATATIPPLFERAVTTPLLKKTKPDHNMLKNYRPESNLPFLSKILEKWCQRP